MSFVYQSRLYSDQGEWSCVLRPVSGVPGTAQRGGGAAFTPAGSSYVTFGANSASDYVHQGQRYTADGAACITAEAPAAGDYVGNGFRYDQNGRLYITSGAFSSSDDRGGIRRNQYGAVYISGTALADYVATLSPEAWYRSGQGITSSGGLVSAWADQSGNGRDLVQATGTNQPTLDVDNSILFDGVDNFMRVAFTLNQPCTIYFLVKQVTWTSGRALGGGATDVVIYQNPSTPSLRLNAGSGAADNSGLAVGAYGAVCAVFNGASSLLQVNNGAPTTGNAGANVAGGVTLGDNFSSGAPCNESFKEAVYFSVAHDAATRARVIRYLQQVGSI